mmetsp:Transcript_22522/g.57156  ORF Transcript_22522/g.57156 Transcript_22522/m.57156 type:complete len:333 (-) Transcript_22522:430-1428(-)
MAHAAPQAFTTRSPVLCRAGLAASTAQLVRIKVRICEWYPCTCCSSLSRLPEICAISDSCCARSRCIFSLSARSCSSEAPSDSSVACRSASTSCHSFCAVCIASAAASLRELCCLCMRVVRSWIEPICRLSWCSLNVESCSAASLPLRCARQSSCSLPILSTRASSNSVSSTSVSTFFTSRSACVSDLEVRACRRSLSWHLPMFSFSCSIDSARFVSACLSFSGEGTICARSESFSCLAESSVYLVSEIWSPISCHLCLRLCATSFMPACCWLSSAMCATSCEFSASSSATRGSSDARCALIARISAMSLLFSASSAAFCRMKPSLSLVKSW